MRIAATCSLPTECAELYEVPVTVDYDDDTGVASLVSARIGALILTADQVALMCDGLAWIEKTLTEWCHDHAGALMADERGYHDSLQIAAE